MSMIDNDAPDAYLGVLASATTIYAMEDEPADLAAAIAGQLGSATYAPGDFQIQDNGEDRELLVSEQQDVSCTTSGTVNFYAYSNGTKLLAVMAADGSSVVQGLLFTMQPGAVQLPPPVLVY